MRMGNQLPNIYILRTIPEESLVIEADRIQYLRITCPTVSVTFKSTLYPELVVEHTFCINPANLLRLLVENSIPKPAVRNLSGAAVARRFGSIHALTVSRSGSPSQIRMLRESVRWSGLLTNPISPSDPATIDDQGRPSSSRVVIGIKGRFDVWKMRCCSGMKLRI